MQHALTSRGFSLFSRRFTSSAHPVKVCQRKHQEGQIMGEYLSCGFDEEILHLDCGPGQSQYSSADRAGSAAVVRNSGDTRLPFSRDSFRAITCFRADGSLTADNLDDLFWEISRVSGADARLLIEIPAARRQAISVGNDDQDTSGEVLTAADLELSRGTRWRQIDIVGINLLPVERLPRWFQPLARKLNDCLCRTSLHKYARSRVHILELR